MIERKSITIYDEDTAMTLLKPLHSEYQDYLIVIHEDAYGEVISSLTPINTIKLKLKITSEEFDEMLNKI